MDAKHKIMAAQKLSGRIVRHPSCIVETPYAIYLPMHTFCAPSAPPINGYPKR